MTEKQNPHYVYFRTSDAIDSVEKSVKVAQNEEEV
jgi:hypothetical protein